MLTGLVGAIGVASLLVLFAGAYTNLYRVDADVQTLGKALLVVFALYAPVKVENMTFERWYFEERRQYQSNHDH